MASTRSISLSPFPPARRSGLLRYHLGLAWRLTSSSRLEATQGGPHRAALRGSEMEILIVGIGALGGTIAARAIRAGLAVRLAARSADSAEALRRSGLRVSGIGGEVRADVIEVAAVEAYGKGGPVDLILLATKAQDALEVAPHVVGALAPGGVMLPIQNGGVARVLADRLGEDRVLGGFSNLGATMVEPGVYEQKNAGHLLIGELAGGVSERVERVAHVLGRAIEVKVSSNLTGA